MAGYKIVEFAPPKAQRRNRELVGDNEVIVRLPDKYKPTRPMTRENILAAFDQYEGKWYDFGELLNIEGDDDGRFWDWLGDRLDFGSEYKVCSTGLAQIMLAFGVWPFGEIPENVHTPPGMYYHYLTPINAAEAQVGDYILTDGKSKWYEFWLKWAYKRIRVKNKQVVPDDSKAWPWTHVSQITAVYA